MLRVENISKEFSEDRQALKESSFTVSKGEYVSIVGKSGCGKTTLLNIITGMLPPTDGHVYIDDIDIYGLKSGKRTRLRGGKIGYLNYGNCLLENLTIYENIVYPVLINGGKCEREKALSIMERLKIKGIRNSYPWQVSSGEYRRACMGRVLALDTELVVLDEPTSNLDEKSAEIIYQIIHELQGKKEL